MTARILARDGARVRLLPIIDNDKKKNPDAINLKTGILIDFKNAQGTNGKNAVQSAIKEASKQGVEEVVIRFQEKK